MGEAIKLRDGSEVTLRPLTPDDRERIRRAFDRLSPESRYRRFFVSLRELSDGLLDLLTDVDHDSHEALVGLEPQSEEIVGVARYVRMLEEPERAEASVAVVDDWQGRGLGRALLERLVTRAREMGVSLEPTEDRLDGPAVRTRFGIVKLLEVQRRGHRRIAAGPDGVRRDRRVGVGVAHHVDQYAPLTLCLALLGRE